MKRARVLVVLLGCWAVSARGAEPGAAAAVSTFAPIAELQTLLRGYADDCQSKVRDAAAYKSGQSQVERDAHTLRALGVALALHDQDGPLKKLAAGIVAAAAQLSESTSLEESQAAVAALLEALAQPADGAETPTSWETGASMDQLMKQVAFLNGKLKRGTKGARFAANAEENARHATVLAVIAQAVHGDTVGIDEADKLAKWQEFCLLMRGEAASLHAALVAKDADQTTAALGRLEQSCTACHKVFKPDLP